MAIIYMRDDRKVYVWMSGNEIANFEMSYRTVT